jgi:hypothetical protein
MKGSSSLTSCHLPILSRLLSSLIWAQLTLLVPALGIRTPPSPKWQPHSQGPRILPYRDPEHYILYSLFCILFSVFCFLFSVFCILYSEFCILYSFFYILYATYSLYSIFYILYFIFYTLHSIFCILYSVFCILYSIFYILFSIFYFLFSIFYTLRTGGSAAIQAKVFSILYFSKKRVKNLQNFRQNQLDSLKFLFYVRTLY